VAFSLEGAFVVLSNLGATIYEINVTACDIYSHGRWFSLGTPDSSITKTGRHDIVEILLKVALNTKNQIKSNQIVTSTFSRVRTHAVLVIGLYELLDPAT
jgi:hypothetical protein